MKWIPAYYQRFALAPVFSMAQFMEETPQSHASGMMSSRFLLSPSAE